LWWGLLEPLRGYSLDGRWYCSPECFGRALAATIRQFSLETVHPPPKDHRLPLGLLMLSRGLVDDDQLKQALKAQKDSGSGRVGEWLRHIGAVSEEQVTQILGLQLSIPVFPLNQSRRFLECAHLVPFSLLEVAEMVPVHHIATSQNLYLAFSDRINYSALYAVDKLLDCHTEPCLALQSQVVQALSELRGRPHPVEILVDNISDPAEMASTILAHAEGLGAADVRVSGFDGLIWARLLSPSGYTDIMFQAPRNPTELLVPVEAR
jgi:hypothetical protein